MISFASDNHSFVRPKLLEAFDAANKGQCPAYGNYALNHEVRLMTSLDTQKEDIDAFVQVLNTII